MNTKVHRKKGQSTLEYMLLFVGIVLVIQFVAVQENAYSIRKGYSDALTTKVKDDWFRMSYRLRIAMGCKKPAASCTRHQECCSGWCTPSLGCF